VQDVQWHLRVRGQCSRVAWKRGQPASPRSKRR
jgi:hypothetical protein